MSSHLPKVAILCGSLSRTAGGILPIMQNHAIELRRLGLEVTAHGAGDPHLAKDAPDWGGVPLHAHRNFVVPLAFAPGIDASLKVTAPDIVHQHAIWQYASVAASRWRRRTGRPVVISTQGMLEPWALSNSRLKKKVAEFLFERKNLEAASVIHCSRAEVAGVRAFGLRNPIAVLPNGAVLSDRRAPISRPSFLPADGRKTLLFLGRLHPKKGISETLRAFSKFKGIDPVQAGRWRLVIAGWDDGGHLDRFTEEATALGLVGDVNFPGPLFGEEKQAAFAHADAFILASYSEGFPMAVMEAWANALPVFMTRECNIPEGFDVGAAIEVTTDSDVLAARMAEHLPRSDLNSIGEAGRTLVAERFSWPMVAAQLLDVYRWVLGQGPEPACIDRV